MDIIGLVILGMAFAFVLSFLGEIGLQLLGGAIFGLLLYIALVIKHKK